MKRRKSIKFIALLLVLALVISACGGGGSEVATPDSDSTTQDTASSGSAPADTSSGQTSDGDREFDLGGRTISILCWWEYGINSDTPDPDPETSWNYGDHVLQHENLKRIEEKYNVRIATPSMAWEEILPAVTTGVLAGEPIADVVMFAGQWLLTGINNNLILPVSAYTTPDQDIHTEQKWAVPGTYYNNEYWSIGPAELDIGCDGLGYNIDLIRAIGADDPADLVARGEWTWDKFREIALLATADTDGDGQNDRFGISGWVDPFVRNLVAANDGAFVNENNGFALSEPKTMKAMEFLYDLLMTDGVWQLGPENSVDGGDFLQGNSAFWPFAHWYFGDGTNFNYGYVPYPTGPDNTKGYTNMTAWGQSLVIPVGVEDPDIVFMIMQDYFAWMGEDTYIRDEGTMDWLRSFLPTDTDLSHWLDIACKTRKTDLGLIIDGYAQFQWDFVDGWLDGSLTVAQGVEQVRQPMEDMLAAAFGQ